MSTKIETMLIKARDAREKAFKDKAIFVLSSEGGEVDIVVNYTSSACRVYLSDGYNVTEGVATGSGYDRLTQAVREAAVRMCASYTAEKHAPGVYRIIQAMSEDAGGSRFGSSHPVAKLECVSFRQII